MNNFWGNSESLWQCESQNCESLLADLRITFQKILQRPFFLILTPFLGTFHIYDAKMRIRCEL